MRITPYIFLKIRDQIPKALSELRDCENVAGLVLNEANTNTMFLGSEKTMSLILVK